ncbi:hypothetical protein RLO149_c010960 [Roseobacter litoralis Och 149]|uniref:Uncharacterized protein n=1 Tax=Roseobacter litoralis (strain ATCC 49566 / DSM 6996 / JCM 21268 / NBRC 15278 / OCh 149) TaxID=391595 RepID=F7ZBR1_ROSLO|nr:hypothetical protein RLO149_c010960 [Roseobacter litoralis Och 149]
MSLQGYEGRQKTFQKATLVAHPRKSSLSQQCGIYHKKVKTRRQKIVQRLMLRLDLHATNARAQRIHRTKPQIQACKQ